MIRQTKTTVAFDGDPYIYTLPGFFQGGLTLAVTPGEGGTMLVEYRLTSTSDWREWPGGAVSVYTEDSLETPVQALRFTSTLADGVVEITQ